MYTIFKFFILSTSPANKDMEAVAGISQTSEELALT
jgi:hypothetical protein